MKPLLIAVTGFVIVACLVLLWQLRKSAADDRAAERASQELASLSVPLPDRYEPVMVSALPEPARRFFNFAIEPDTRLDGLLVMIGKPIVENPEQVLDFAASARLPASFDTDWIVREGGLISYGPVLLEQYALAADYVDKILRGAKPSELPIQQPTRFTLVVNLKSAKSLGLTIPRSVLLRADEVIN